jgi:hypothetical protein
VFGEEPAPPLEHDGALNLLTNRTFGKAAALGANLSTTSVSAEITGTGSVTAVNSPLNVIATSDDDSLSLGSASAVNNAAAIAAGLALNAALSNNIASISGNATADQITVRTDSSDDGVHTVAANSIAGISDVAGGASGAAAVTQAQGISNAFIGSGATLTLTNDGDLTVRAEMEIDNVAQATPVVAAGTILGAGASFELNSGVCVPYCR